ncbi:aryl-alcohol oxidase-like protein [Ephemerocybe angulata]|uniref:pyranose dehydrogenase (acceptor) n=1 Tax=Ephemerocybe angulata TaxID=980116 RepID=A0A8H6M6F6_9AGAR|nr:aryl-alcohol oxidase-like protein [Tulosesus angulatus]
MVSLSLRFCSLLALVPLAAVGSVIPRADAYDYIVVGGGSAGSIIASRLSENSSVSVLVIEGGPSHEGEVDLTIPYVYPRTFRSRFDWNYTTVPQPNLGNRPGIYLRGHVLGGSSSINGMTLNRAPASDWDKIASYTGDSSFRWDAILPYIKKNEGFNRPPNTPEYANTYDPAVHGFNADKIGNTLVTDGNWISQPALQAATEVGINYVRDVNGGLPVGISWQQFSTKDGSRSSAATAYLSAGILSSRTNLKVLLNAFVTRLLPVSGTDLKFTTVEYKDASGNTVTVSARREVILSAGVMSTPIILMRSGLGPRAHLQANNITTILDVPAVGQNLQDRCGAAAVWSVNATDTDDDIDRNPAVFNRWLNQWNQNHTGRLTQMSYRQMIFGRVPNNASIFSGGFQDPSSGPTCPHYELYPANKWTSPTTPQPATGNFVSMNIFVSASNVRGTVTLDPTNPLTGNPVIDPKYLSSEWDRYVMRDAVRTSVRYFNAPAWKKWNATPVFDTAILNSDAALDAWISSSAFGGVHGVGTARMGPANSPAGQDVVAPNFKVKGVSGLRIADTSVFPFVINGHTMGATYAIAEKVSDLIKSGN